MADNVQITPGSGAIIGADSCTVNGAAGVLVPLGKLGYGANDAFTYVTSTAGLPVAQQGTWSVNVTQAGDNVEIGGVAYPIVKAFANPSSSGDNTILAGTTGKKVRLLSYAIGPVAAAVSVYFKATTPGAISSTKAIAANSGMGRSFTPSGVCPDTGVGDPLILNLSAAGAVGIDFAYILI